CASCTTVIAVSAGVLGSLDAEIDRERTCLMADMPLQLTFDQDRRLPQSSRGDLRCRFVTWMRACTGMAGTGPTRVGISRESFVGAHLSATRSGTEALAVPWPERWESRPCVGTNPTSRPYHFMVHPAICLAGPAFCT